MYLEALKLRLLIPGQKVDSGKTLYDGRARLVIFSYFASIRLPIFKIYKFW